MDNADVYTTTRRHLLDLAATLDDEQVDAPVPALPGWTVKDAYAHLTGLCADVLDGRREGLGSPDSSAAQVAARADRSLGAVTAEWKERGPDLDHWLREQPPEAPPFMVFDVWSHEQDIRGALGLMGERADPRVAYLADRAFTSFDGRYRTTGAPTLRLTGSTGDWVLGEGEPAATLRGDDYELLRIVFGRRSRAQIEAADWDGHPEPFVDHLHLFDLPRTDLDD